jgi:hypothetical protein
MRPLRLMSIAQGAARLSATCSSNTPKALRVCHIVRGNDGNLSPNDGNLSPVQTAHRCRDGHLLPHTPRSALQVPWQT